MSMGSGGAVGGDNASGHEPSGLFADPELVDGDNERVLSLAGVVERARVAQLAGLVAAMDEGSFARDGATSLTSWLIRRGGQTRLDATRLVKLVNLLRRIPDLMVALEAGWVQVAHVEALARVATDRRRRALQEFARQLVAHACALCPEEFGLLCQRWAELADEHMAEPAGRDGYWLNLTPSLFGETDLRGHLTADQSEAVSRALDRLNGPDPVNAPMQRSVGQRNADALTDLALHFLNEPPSKDAGPCDIAGVATGGRRAKPSALVTLDLDTLVDRNRELGFADVGSQLDLASIRRRLLTGGILPKPVAELLTCDAHLRRVIVDAVGQSLDVGRPVATVTEAQRLALLLRDGGCQFPSCDRPAHWCDAHHLHRRSQGGATDLGNLVLLCRRHHREVHSHRWRLCRDPVTGVVSAVRSDGQVYRRDVDGQVGVTEPVDVHTLDPPLRP